MLLAKRSPSQGGGELLAAGRWLAAGCCLLAATGCTTLAPADTAATSRSVAASAPGSVAARCERAFAALDAAVARAGVADAEGSRVAGFAYLRSNRLLASFRAAGLDGAAERAWHEAMMQLDREGRLVEIANLPPAATQDLLTALHAEGFAALPPVPWLEGCGKALGERDLADPAARERLRSAAAVPDDYATWKRVLGLYALTRIPFAAGVRRWQDDTRAVFAVPLEQQSIAGRLAKYSLDPAAPLPDPEAAAPLPRAEAVAPLPRAEAARRLADARAGSPLGLHDPQVLLGLAATYAPVFVVDEASPADRVGRPVFDATGLPTVDAALPAIFVRATHTRYRDQVLPQLVYTVWFPERPKDGPFDLLGGRLDSVVWRVTLAEDGEPLLFDTIHGCGCYHLFFPTPRATPLPPPPDTLDEHAFVPARLPRLADGERVVVRIAPGTHYVSAVAAVPAPSVGTLRLHPADEASLRSLPDGAGGRRSLYGPDGIVRGSERGERYVFWPMGVAEPGAQRQWGRHATAFVGRRHFDDADLLERNFRLELRAPARPSASAQGENQSADRSADRSARRGR